MTSKVNTMIWIEQNLTDSQRLKNVMLCGICYHLYNLKNVKNTHGGVLFLVKLQASVYNFTRSLSPPWVFSRYLNCANGTKSRKASQIFFEKILLLFIKIWSNSVIQLQQILTFSWPKS